MNEALFAAIVFGVLGGALGYLICSLRGDKMHHKPSHRKHGKKRNKDTQLTQDDNVAMAAWTIQDSSDTEKAFHLVEAVEQHDMGGPITLSNWVAPSASPSKKDNSMRAHEMLENHNFGFSDSYTNNDMHAYSGSLSRNQNIVLCPAHDVLSRLFEIPMHDRDAEWHDKIEEILYAVLTERIQNYTTDELLPPINI